MTSNRVRKTPEVSTGDYFFDGHPVMTRGVQGKVDLWEVRQMIISLQKLAQASGGLDYLQVFENAQGEKVWVMDASPRSVLLDNDMVGNIEYHHVTVLLPEEY